MDMYSNPSLNASLTQSNAELSEMTGSFQKEINTATTSSYFWQYLMRGHLYPRDWLISFYCNNIRRLSYARALTMAARLGEEIPLINNDADFMHYMHTLAEKQKRLHEQAVNALPVHLQE